jgi:hypothetical protein
VGLIDEKNRGSKSCDSVPLMLVDNRHVVVLTVDTCFPVGLMLVDILLCWLC